MRVVFMGTPEFAVPVLDALVSNGFHVVGVISQPDREKDKKGNLLPTPVKTYALSHGLTCLQFDKVSDHTEELRVLAPDVAITAAYGQLLRADVLTVPKYGILNVHASLLPKYRGSSPIQSAILCGETVTGVTLMKTELGMDTGDMLAVCEVPILPTDTAGSLSEKLSKAGAELLIRSLPEYVAGKIRPIAQDDAQATYCKKIGKSDGLIDWTMNAQEIFCKIRAYNPWPIAYSFYNGVPFKIYAAEETDESFGAAGKICVVNQKMYVACGKGSLCPILVQLPGKKVLPVADFLRGHKIPQGSVLNNG